jgi:TetR/AcrR family transcriptional repressor of nem operon
MDMQVDARARALAAAMEVFWRRGADQTRYDDLVAVTGLSRKGLYALWPDKATLVRETLDLYRRTELEATLARLRPPGAEGLRRFWTALEDGARVPGWNGCYLVRSASGELRGDREVRALFDGWLEALTQALIDAILAAIRDLPRSRVMDAGAAAWQAAALVTLASTLGGQRGYDARVAEVFRAGRLACGLPPA